MGDDSVLNQLLPLYSKDDVTAAEVLRAVLRAYEADTGLALDPSNLDDATRDDLYQYLSGPDSRGSALLYKPRVLKHLPLYASSSAKLSWLIQAPCNLCTAPGPSETFPLDVPPWSHQVAAYVGPALHRALTTSEPYATHFRERGPLTHPLCLRIVFSLGDAATMKDCDNMAKGLVDAWQGVLYENDRQIRHLDLVKISNSGDASGHIRMGWRPTDLDDHDNVLVRRHGSIAFLDAPTLNLSAYLPNPR